jgi:hypothetical protein
VKVRGRSKKSKGSERKDKERDVRVTGMKGERKKSEGEEGGKREGVTGRAREK